GLLADLLLAAPPPTGRDARGPPPVHAGGVDGHRGAETRPHRPDTVSIDLGPGGEKRERALRVLDLLQTDHAAARALTLAAAAHVEPERRVSELGEQLRGRRAPAAVLAAPEPVQDEKRGPALARPAAVGQVEHPGERQAVGFARHAFFHAALLAGL